MIIVPIESHPHKFCRSINICKLGLDNWTSKKVLWKRFCFLHIPCPWPLFRIFFLVIMVHGHCLYFFSKTCKRSSRVWSLVMQPRTWSLIRYMYFLWVWAFPPLVLNLLLVTAIRHSIVTEPRNAETSMAWMPLFLGGRSVLIGRLPRRLCDLLAL